ncbi:Variant-specific surface protein [Giardia duodenalis]|uniref:Variant-specific surface protein n=1 Tax=Giardia intestinalis TaxID=5741 RepID=V6THZ9_GIAIN|nr:Variant-specific surface protein [Giardia intestinalis]
MSLCSTEFRDRKQDPVRLLMQTRAVLCQLLASMLVGIGLIFAVALGQCQVDQNGCAECDSGNTNCIKCKPDAVDGKQYLKDGTCVTAEECRQAAGYYPDDTTDAKNKKCMTCDSTCATCSGAGANKCTKCKPDAGDGKQYLKDGTCVTAEECTSDKTHFTKEKAGDSKGMCLSCSDATRGITGCKKCALKTLSGEAESTVVCSECTNKRLTPSGNACLDNCPTGTYADNINGVSVCASCHATCAECNGNADAASCTACYPGYSLLYGSGTAGTCVKECTGAFGANCADGQCTADVGGAKYCAQCKDGYAPIDGICTVVAAAGRANVCTAAGGKCTACTGAYVLISGGCYGVAKLPGKAICTAANNGKCTMCAANGQAPVQEKCPECSEGCAKCNDSNACTECLPGYYKNKSSACIPCSKDSTPITGVPNCVSCAPPTGGNGGPVTCYIKTDGTNDGGNDNNSGSTNKSGLSTGAIAGISVAVIVVVGGLVGFLCWWFICRGKA